MRRVVMWFLFSLKREVKHVMFWLLILLLPIVIFALKKAQSSNTEGIHVGLYCEPSDMGEELTATLVAPEGKSMFTFVRCESLEEMIRMVENEELECGFVIPVDLESRLDTGNYNRLIPLYRSPASAADSFAYERFFAALIRIYGKSMIHQLVFENPMFENMDRAEAEQQILSLYQIYETNGSTFTFQYETIEGKAVDQAKGSVTFPIRGVLAVFLFLAGLTGGLSYCQDWEKNIFTRLTRGEQAGFCLASIAATLCPIMIMGLIVLAITGEIGNPGIELINLLEYSALLLVFCGTYTFLIRKPVWYTASIPIWLMGSLIFTPIFFDITAWLPQVSMLAKIFPPYYYIK